MKTILATAMLLLAITPALAGADWALPPSPPPPMPPPPANLDSSEGRTWQYLNQHQQWEYQQQQNDWLSRSLSD
jgi:hypothetical protein